MSSPAQLGVMARVTLQASSVYLEIEEASASAADAIGRALRAVILETGPGCEPHGPFATKMVSPPTTYGLVRLPGDGATIAEDRLYAARAVARALLRDAGYAVNWS